MAGTTNSQPRVNRFRFSLRSILVALFIVSVLLSCLAFHMGRLNRQENAASYLIENNCKTFIGEIDDLSTFNFLGADGESALPGSVTLLMPYDNSPRKTGFLYGMIGDWLFRRDQTAWIGINNEKDDKKLRENLANMPWLKYVVVESRLVPMVTSEGSIESRFECAMTDDDLTSLKREFPGLVIKKSYWVNR